MAAFWALVFLFGYVSCKYQSQCCTDAASSKMLKCDVENCDNIIFTNLDGINVLKIRPDTRHVDLRWVLLNVWMLKQSGKCIFLPNTGCYEGDKSLNCRKYSISWENKRKEPLFLSNLSLLL